MTDALEQLTMERRGRSTKGKGMGKREIQLSWLNAGEGVSPTYKQLPCTLSQGLTAAAVRRVVAPL